MNINQKSFFRHYGLLIINRIVPLFIVIVLIFISSGCSDDIGSAAERGDIKAVQQYVDEGQDVNSISKKGRPVLWRAAMNGHAEVVEFLINAGADLNLQNPRGGTALHVAAYKGRTEIVRILINHGADVNALSSHIKATPLYYAAQWGHVEVVKLLIDSGAEVNLKAEPETPLHVAAVLGHSETIRILLDAGADVNASNNEGRTPLFSAVSGLSIGETGLVKTNDVITLLVENGADLHHRDKNGETALEYARHWKISKAVEILTELQKKHDDNIKDDSNKTDGSSLTIK